MEFIFLANGEKIVAEVNGKSINNDQETGHVFLPGKSDSGNFLSILLASREIKVMRNKDGTWTEIPQE